MHRLINKRRGEDGFTLIELLVVVVIIGILVAIAIPVYLNYRQGAADKSAQSDVRGAISAVEQYYTENNNQYPPQALDQDASFDLGTSQLRVTLSDGTTLTFKPVGSGSAYVICATNSGGEKTFRYSSTAGGSVGEAPAGMTTTSCAP